jgi:hypothetical protein
VSETGNNQSESWRDVHPDFDGHLEKPLLKMTVEERLEWLRQGMLLLHWRDTQVRKTPRDDSGH